MILIKGVIPSEPKTSTLLNPQHSDQKLYKHREQNGHLRAKLNCYHEDLFLSNNVFLYTPPQRNLKVEQDLLLIDVPLREVELDAEFF